MAVDETREFFEKKGKKIKVFFVAKPIFHLICVHNLYIGLFSVNPLFGVRVTNTGKYIELSGPLDFGFAANDLKTSSSELSVFPSELRLSSLYPN